MNLALELHVTATQRGAAKSLLQQHCDLEPEAIQACFDNGAVWIETGHKPFRIRDSKRELSRDQQIHLYCNASTLQPCPYQPTLVEDFTDFSIWNKPSGMLSQGSKWGDHWALYRWIEQHGWPDRKSYITHRLDRYTQGLMIVAHTADCNSALHRMFENHQVSKTYRAIVHGLIESSEEFEISDAIQHKRALTTIRVLEKDEQRCCTLIEALPQSGRKHQIRIHLAGIGHPILNDRQYGIAPHQGDLQLQACALAFKHPHTQQALQIQLPQTEKLSIAHDL